MNVGHTAEKEIEREKEDMLQTSNTWEQCKGMELIIIPINFPI